jgi:U3 small nucleolar RNA-associated protein 11
LSNDAVKLMKTQDVGYLRTVLQQTRRERERLEQEFVSGEVGVKVNAPVSIGKKTVFGDDGDSRLAESTRDERNDANDVDEWFSEDESEASSEENLNADQQQKKHAQTKRRKKLDALRDRENELSAALGEVETQRARMNSSIGGINKKGINFKVRDRKR